MREEERISKRFADHFIEQHKKDLYLIRDIDNFLVPVPGITLKAFQRREHDNWEAAFDRPVCEVQLGYHFHQLCVVFAQRLVVHCYPESVLDGEDFPIEKAEELANKPVPRAWFRKHLFPDEPFHDQRFEYIWERLPLAVSEGRTLPTVPFLSGVIDRTLYEWTA